MSHTVLFFDNCGHSAVWPLVPHAMVDLEREGLDFQPHVSPAWNDPCMAVCSPEGAPMGFLIYRYDDVKCAWFIMLAYVKPEYRRQGVHSAMFAALVDRAKKRGDILSIDCGTHVGNAAAQAAFESQGRIRKSVFYSYPLKAWIDGKDPADIPK